MVTLTVSHYWGHAALGSTGASETIALPISISESEIEILFSDCCEPIVQPPITSNDLCVLRRALVEFDHDPALAEQLDGHVIGAGEEVW